MTERPTGPELLEIARSALVEQLVPHLPPEHRYTALMIGAAMAIARREMAAGEDCLRSEISAIERLLGDDADPSLPLPEALETLNREFSVRLRRGDFDSRMTDAQTVLRRSVLARLAVSNPDYPAER